MALWAVLRTKRQVATLIGVAALSLTMAAPAFAAPESSEVEVQAGTLDITSTISVGDFEAVELDGTLKNTDATLSAIEVTDATGSGAGWRLQAQATQFTEWDTDHYVADSPKLLPTSSLSVAHLTVTPDEDTTSPSPTATSGANAIDTGSAVTLATAAAGEGMGIYTFDDAVGGAGIALSLTIKPETYAATYRSDVTISVVSGPS